MCSCAGIRYKPAIYPRNVLYLAKSDRPTNSLVWWAFLFPYAFPYRRVSIPGSVLGLLRSLFCCCCLFSRLVRTHLPSGTRDRLACSPSKTLSLTTAIPPTTLLPPPPLFLPYPFQQLGARGLAHVSRGPRSSNLFDTPLSLICPCISQPL
jgi:hypothetical protein